MNRSRIEWTDFTWNPVTGCRHNCPYCYARKMSRRFGQTWRELEFEPTFHPKRIDEPLRRKKPAKIFVCSMADLFGRWVPTKWIDSVLETVRAAPWHTYQFLTKAPGGLIWHDFPAHAWVGVTVTRQAHLEPALRALDAVSAPSVKFLSFEPFLERINLPYLLPINWAIVGGLTGAPWDVEAMAPEVSRLVEALDAAGVPVFQKPNLGAARAKWAVSSGIEEAWPDA